MVLLFGLINISGAHKMSENNYIVKEYQKNIDFKELFFELLSRWYILVSSILLAIIIAVIYSTLIVTPKYVSTAKVMIISQKAYNSLSEMELSHSTLLTKDFSEIITDKSVLSEVAKELDNKYTSEQIKGFVSLYNPSETRIIEISASCPNAKDSKKIVDAICVISQEKIVDLMGLDKITIISRGEVPKHYSTPKNSYNIRLGITIGAIAGLAIILYLYITNNKVNTPEDIGKYLDVSVLAVIPYNNKNTSKNQKLQYR